MTIRRALENELAALAADRDEAMACGHYKAAAYIRQQIANRTRRLDQLNRERAAQIAAATLAIAAMETAYNGQL